MTLNGGASKATAVAAFGWCSCHNWTDGQTFISVGAVGYMQYHDISIFISPHLPKCLYLQWLCKPLNSSWKSLVRKSKKSTLSTKTLSICLHIYCWHFLPDWIMPFKGTMCSHDKTNVGLYLILPALSLLGWNSQHCHMASVILVFSFCSSSGEPSVNCHIWGSVEPTSLTDAMAVDYHFWYSQVFNLPSFIPQQML